MSTTRDTSKVDELIRRLDEAVAVHDDAIRCQQRQARAHRRRQSGEYFIDPPFLQPIPERYARRLLHRDPEGRYTVIVMVWGVGQGTPLHDHAGIWCVECVYRGRIQVTSFSVRGGDPESGDRPVRQGEGGHRRRRRGGRADSAVRVPHDRESRPEPRDHDPRLRRRDDLLPRLRAGRGRRIPAQVSRAVVHDGLTAAARIRRSFRVSCSAWRSRSWPRGSPSCRG